MTIEIKSKKDYIGSFEIGGRNIQGQLKINKSKTRLKVEDNEFIAFERDNRSHICGVLQNSTRITLVNTIMTSGPGRRTGHSTTTHLASFFPHYIVHGGSHLDVKSSNIISLKFYTDDMDVLFYDFDAFSTVSRPGRRIRSIVNTASKELNRNIDIGKDPIIAYFSGKREIVRSETKIGTVIARHNPSYNFGGPAGVSIKNAISIEITFDDLVHFEEAINRYRIIMSFMEILIGRRQKLKSMTICVSRSKKVKDYLNVVLSLPPKRTKSSTGKPSPGDSLIMAADNPNEFSRVIKSWVERHQSWVDARIRYLGSSSMGRNYTIDRLVGSANMFDIIPIADGGFAKMVDSKVLDARDQAKKIFKSLPMSPERDSVLGALGRIDKISLRDKIKSRAEIIIRALPARFSGILQVVELAVDCRNHFVHGSPAKAEYTKNFFETVPFFCNTLEFIFAASDLINCGWDIDTWHRRGSSLTHPMSDYLVNYMGYLRKMNSVLPEKHKVTSLNDADLLL